MTEYTTNVPDEWISALSLEDTRAQLTYALTQAEGEKARSAQAEMKAIGLQGELNEARVELAQAMKPCTWTLADDDSGTWEGSCGTAWTFIDDGPAENGLRFCPHCGHPVVIADDDRPEAEE